MKSFSGIPLLWQENRQAQAFWVIFVSIDLNSLTKVAEGQGDLKVVHATVLASITKLTKSMQAQA